MTPVRSPISPASFSSSTLSDVVSSYRRAQTFLSGSNIATHHEYPDNWQDDEECGPLPEHHDFEDETALLNGDVPTPRQVDYSYVDPLWDVNIQPAVSASLIIRTESERTPLLTKKPSNGRVSNELDRLVRGISTSSLETKQPKYIFQSGKSTYRQTLFNSTAILLGIGMLSEPLAFAFAGWITGTIIIIFYGFLTCYTARILAQFIREDPSLRTYADIGLKAFGGTSKVLTGLLFCLELFSVCVILVTLVGDSLNLVIPKFDANQYKIMAGIILIPTMFLPLSVLAYTSVIGIISTFLIMSCIMIDGFSKFDSPGSLWQPADTVLYVIDVRKLGVAFGLFMAGFGGHAVIPSLVRDMQDPSQFDEMIKWAFGIATFVYGVIGAAGYLMFGDAVGAEISKNILEVPEYNQFLNKLTVWMLVITPLTKYALNARPLSLSIEIWLGLDKPVPAQLHANGCPLSPDERSATALETSPHTSRHPVVLVIERIFLVILSIGVSILIPEFSAMMAFLGSFSAFMLCVIGPLSAKIAIQKSCGVLDGFLLVVSAVFTIWGTVAAFMRN